MAVIEGTTNLKVWKGEYSFAVDAGAIGAIVLRSNHGPIPAGSIIWGGTLEVTTLFTTGTSATGAVSVEGANDLVSATIVSGAPFSTTGRKAIVPVMTAGTSLKTTVPRSPTFTIATGTVTAGVFTLHLIYE